MVHGLKGRELFSAETVLISVPYQWIPIMIQNLKEMKMHLPSHASKEQYLGEFGNILGDLAKESENP
jgi:hypothetical protein